MIAEDDQQAIIDAVHSYRQGAPITTFDIRIACRMDGHPIDHITGGELGQFMRTVCRPEKYGHDKNRRSWVW